MPTVKVTTTSNGKVYARAPYSMQFNKFAKQLGGSWDPILRLWKFPVGTDAELIGNELESIWGQGDAHV